MHHAVPWTHFCGTVPYERTLVFHQAMTSCKFGDEPRFSYASFPQGHARRTSMWWHCSRGQSNTITVVIHLSSFAWYCV